MSATVRFLKVVEAAGKPQLHTLWGSPTSDAEFQKAVKAQRVMTIRQENVGTKKDFGLIGFSPEGRAQFLVFPRSLKPFQGRRVVGINYDLFAPPAAPGAAWKVDASKEKRSRTALKIKTATSSKTTKIPAASEAREETPPKENPTDDAPDPTPPPPLPKEKRVQKVETAPSPRITPKKNPASEWNRAAVLKELKSAMKELEAGKAVLVFRRLEQLVNDLAASE